MDVSGHPLSEGLQSDIGRLKITETACKSENSNKTGIKKHYPIISKLKFVTIQLNFPLQPNRVRKAVWGKTTLQRLFLYSLFK